MVKPALPVTIAEVDIHRVVSTGMVFYEDMIEGIDKMIAMCHPHPSLLILDDARGSVPRFSIREMKQLVHYLRDNLPGTCRIRHAVIHSDPMTTAYAFMVIRMGVSPHYTLEVFSTEAPALAWLTES